MITNKRHQCRPKFFWILVHRDRSVGSLVFRESLVPIPMIQCRYDSIAYNSVVGIFEQC